MTAAEHNKYLAIAFGIFAAILGLTFLLLMLVSLGVFLGLGISFANETGDANQAGVGILGGMFAVIFYVVLGLLGAAAGHRQPQNVETETWRARVGNHRGDLTRLRFSGGDVPGDLRILVLVGAPWRELYGSQERAIAELP